MTRKLTRRRIIQAGVACSVTSLTALETILLSREGVQAETRYLFDAQQRREIQTRAKWAAIDGRQNVSAPGASCGPINMLGQRQQVVPRGEVWNIGNGRWTIWEECYAFRGQNGENLYLRLAWESHPFDDSERKACTNVMLPIGNVKHFNITIAQQGNYPDNFNSNSSNRNIISDEHIAIWKDGKTNQTCISWWHTPYVNRVKQKHICIWAKCGTNIPISPFAPWTVGQAQNYFRERLDFVKRLLVSNGVDPKIAEGIILTIGALFIVALVIEAAPALAILAI